MTAEPTPGGDTPAGPNAVDVASIDEWIASGLAQGLTPRRLVATLGAAMASDLGLPLDGDAPALLSEASPDCTAHRFDVSPSTLGLVFERALDHAHRHSMGVHYTPPAVARGLVRIALEGGCGAVDDDLQVCDPAVGGGVFLLAAAEELAARGVPRADIVVDRLWGVDIDPAAVAVAELALALWGSTTGQWVTPGDHLVCADTLIVGRDAFAHRSRSFELVVGNPPFQNQLGADTARSAGAGAALRRRWSVDAGPYADTAGFFLLAGVELAAPGGVVCLVQPQSVLVTADATAIRDELLGLTALTGLWTADTGVFDASVRVCAPVLTRSSGTGQVRRWVDETFTETDASPPPKAGVSWAPLLADALGVPSVSAHHGPPLGQTCTGTAGFRDQFYGLAPHTGQGDNYPDAPLITVGMIDPLRNRWGTAEFRYAKRRWTRPAVDLASLEADDPTLGRWVADRRTPKVLVATQTKVIEVTVDLEGVLVPSTPVVAIVAPRARLWHVAAALTSPVATALAFRRAAGAALSANTLKLTAAQVLDLPTPVDEAKWDHGAALAEAAQAAAEAGRREQWAALLTELGQVMCTAHGLGPDDTTALLAWWQERLPPWR